MHDAQSPHAVLNPYYRHRDYLGIFVVLKMVTALPRDMFFLVSFPEYHWHRPQTLATIHRTTEAEFHVQDRPSLCLERRSDFDVPRTLLIYY